MEATLQSIIQDAQTHSAHIDTRGQFEQYKAVYVGPNGKLTACMKQMGTLPADQKPAMGKCINHAKQTLEAIFQAILERIEQSERSQKVGPAIDPTLPHTELHRGTQHLLSQMRDRICQLFGRLGFVVAEGPQIDSEWYCFDALNTPSDHPARDAQDTLYLPANVAIAHIQPKAGERAVLRTHTSTVQIRTLLAQEPPIRIIAPGRCFRRDTVDATHSANFHQIEGLYVDTRVSIKDLKDVLDFMVRELFGTTVQTRLRPSFFPFTEPSFEMDMRLSNAGKLSGKWLEIMGCGLVDPKVFEACGYDVERWSGFAFGMGLERMAMIYHGIDDIRHFYQNDQRFLGQFA